MNRIHLKQNLLFLLALVTACVASTAQTPAAESEVLRVGVSPVFPPMVFQRGKELVGVEVDMAHALGRHLNRKVIFVALPWEDQIEALNAEQIDIIMSSMSMTTARQHIIDFAHPYLTVAQMPLVRREDEHRYLLGLPNPLPGRAGVLSATTGEFLVQREFPKTRRFTRPETMRSRH